ncbi:MAG: hypothetical protein IPH22_15815 [Nitrosomonas sp.]|nr:hypothetical protein [Nitrosomonas sp.]
MPYITIDHNADGSNSVNLYLDEIAHIVSGMRPYVLLKRYGKNIKLLNKLTIHHKACPVDSFPQLPDLEARILSIHKINTFFSKLFIVTLVIDTVPRDFFDYVMKKTDQIAHSKDPVLCSSEHSLFSHFRPR